jgi:hypothetical protein
MSGAGPFTRIAAGQTQSPVEQHSASAGPWLNLQQIYSQQLIDLFSNSLILLKIN